MEKWNVSEKREEFFWEMILHFYKRESERRHKEESFA